MSVVEKIRLTILLWRGHVTAAADGARFVCARRHFASNEEGVHKQRLHALEIAADELKLARGVIAGVGKAKEYAEMLKQTIDGAKS